MPPRKPDKVAATQLTSRRPRLGNAVDYFDAEYHQLYEQSLLPPEQTRAEAAHLLKILKPARGARWLDVPCGYGRHLIELENLRPSLRLMGGDLNPYYLHLARARCAARLVRLNLLYLPFPAGSFSIATCLLNSFGYFGSPGDGQILRELGRVLKPGGRLVLDLPNRRALLGVIRRQPIIRYLSAGYEVIEHFRWDAETQAVTNFTQWRSGRKKRQSGYVLRLYTPAQIDRMLISVGFSAERVYGDFTGTPFRPASDRLLIVARRSAPQR